VTAHYGSCGSAVVLGALCLAGSACINNLAGTCENEVKSEVASPRREYVATVYERSCGATTGYSTQVNMRPAGAPFLGEPKLGGSVEDGVVFIADGQLLITVSWPDEERILVTGDMESVKVSRRDSTWKDIAISYSSKEVPVTR
jgi:hypothetical protein